MSFKGCAKDSASIRFILATGKIEGSIKEDWGGYAIGQDNHVVPVGILSLQRKMMIASIKAIMEMGNK